MATVFAETNLGTRIAFPAGLDITAGDLKRELEKEHLMCFPNFREIKVCTLMVMVKTRPCFYHIPDSFPVKHVFQPRKRRWFLHAHLNPNGTSPNINGKPSSGKERVQVSDSNKSVSMEKPISKSPQTITDLSLSTPTNKLVRPRVGERIVSASKSIKISSTKTRPVFSSYRLNGWGVNACSLNKSLVFELSDGSDSSS